MPVLANEIHERYARLRAVLVPPRAAVKALGRNPKTGAASKLEKNRAIQARIAEIADDDEEVLREKRRQIETSLSAIAYGDGTEFPGKKPMLDWPDRLGAITQLRDMHGFKSVNKTALTDPTGTLAAVPMVIEIVKFGNAPAPSDKAAP